VDMNIFTLRNGLPTLKVLWDWKDVEWQHIFF